MSNASTLLVRSSPVLVLSETVLVRSSPVLVLSETVLVLVIERPSKIGWKSTLQTGCIRR